MKFTGVSGCLFFIMTTEASSQSLDQLKVELLAWFRREGPVVVALSGGVDSAVCMALAHEALGFEKALAVTAHSETLSNREFEDVIALAKAQGWNHQVIKYSELEIPNYAENPINRCFFCKSELYGRLVALAGELPGSWKVVQGSQADDQGDWRPGMEAASRHGTRAPLLELGIGKATVRQLAHHYGLPVWDKPASPCLSSRFAYGLKITREGLDRVAAAEEFLRQEGFREFRVRHHDHLARIEIPKLEFSRLLEGDRPSRIVDELRRLGFIYVTLDLMGFRSGSMNEVHHGIKQSKG